MRAFLYLLLSFSISAVCAQDISFYLIGDAGEPKFPVDKTLEYLKHVTREGTSRDILIFLGDNLYPSGLPGKEDPLRPEMERKLDESLKIMKAFKGRSFIIPGNHDWANGRRNGWRQLLNMQRYVDAYMGSETVFLPRDGCPGPVEIEITPKIVLIIMDTQYLLHPWDKPDQGDGCDAKSNADAIHLLIDRLNQHKEKHVIVAGHHPMYSFGPHGSKFTLKQHLFPLTDLNKKLMIPIPVLGSFYALFRSIFGTRQDLSNSRYQLIKNTMTDAFDQVENLVYISGHEHSLQYIQRDKAHYIISGAGSKSSNATMGTGSISFKQTHGFARLTYEQNKPVNLQFYDGEVQKVVYDENIFTKKIEVTDPELFDIDYQDSTVIMPITDRYAGASSAREYWLGKNYREVWATPVEMPVFNIGREHGGLEILKLGGGNQTRSLRLEAKNGRQYVLRTQDKYTEQLIPTALNETLVADIIQDLVSAANPYGAFIAAPLAESAEIYHTNPQLVYIPDDPRFGHYQSIFTSLPVLYEERPNDEAAHEPFFGGGEKIEGTPDVIETIMEDNDEIVDQPFTLRNRLFDMIIGDWDRHEDQWRWVRFDKEPKGHLWRPIPRDRDQAFFVNEGPFGWVASRKFAISSTEGFDEQMDYPPGFNASARFFDRTFLNALSWEDWEVQIEYLEKNLTNQAIAQAFQVLPDTIRQQVGPKTIKVLKARRDDMRRYGRIHYLFLSKEVEVTGSHKHEHFLVERLNDEETRVVVRKTKKDGELEQIIYERIFKKSETKEIRLYGLRGEDIFEVEGEVSDGIRVRIIGGEGKDTITDNSSVKGLSKKTVVYDLKKNTELVESRETRSKLENDIGVNAYDRTAFEYDKLIPVLSTEFNRDDGIFLGGGIMYTKEGWRKDPYAFRHILKANVALATGAVNLYYNGTFSDVIGEWDLNADISLQHPFGVANFFGFGNESDFDYRGEGGASGFRNEIDYYRIRYERSRSYVNLTYNLGPKGVFRFGPEHLFFQLTSDITDKFINGLAETGGLAAATLYDDHHYLGFRTEIETDTRDHSGLPTRGVFARLAYTNYYGLNGVSSDFSTVSGEFRFLLSTGIPSRLFIANRIGVQSTLGDLEFFNGAFLGRETIRGYRRTRFIGNTSFYHNADIRLHLFNFRTYLFPAGVGLVSFHDIGRVWLDGERSDEWHTGKGFGLWLAPLNQFVFVFNLAFSEEETLPFVTFGYQF